MKAKAEQLIERVTQGEEPRRVLREASSPEMQAGLDVVKKHFVIPIKAAGWQVWTERRGGPSVSKHAYKAVMTDRQSRFASEKFSKTRPTFHNMVVTVSHWTDWDISLRVAAKTPEQSFRIPDELDKAAHAIDQLVKEAKHDVSGEHVPERWMPKPD